MSDPDLSDYMKSEQHIRRMADAQRRTEESLKAIMTIDLFHGVSEGMGIIFGVAAVFKAVGLKRMWTHIQKGLFFFMKKGDQT